MELFLSALRREAKTQRQRHQLAHYSDRSRFHPELFAMREAEAQTAGDKRFVLQVAANYGGQWDIAQAAQRLAREVQGGHLRGEDITRFAAKLPGNRRFPFLPDLCIRTGGEHRISNFLLWQLAYTELYFSDLYWPISNTTPCAKPWPILQAASVALGKPADQVGC